METFLRENRSLRATEIACSSSCPLRWRKHGDKAEVQGQRKLLKVITKQKGQTSYELAFSLLEGSLELCHAFGNLWNVLLSFLERGFWQASISFSGIHWNLSEIVLKGSQNRLAIFKVLSGNLQVLRTSPGKFSKKLDFSEVLKCCVKFIPAMLEDKRGF